ncbi:MAG: hypothetical protein PPHEINF_5650 [uncultured Paraburkholderia sp.]|nr:MAG: hypothetical protein PPHEINF_5650 [uncultured Paraburkholderia sp.]CAH2806209.1 MAG: hypothetical protein PPHEESC_5637 [uncultured Paraburkholderia sp.]
MHGARIMHHESATRVDANIAMQALRAPGIPGHTRWRVAPILESPVPDSPPRRRAALRNGAAP